MSEEQPYNGTRALHGCLIAWVAMVIVTMSISLVLNSWLGLISNETERGIIVFVWLFAVCLAGYFAARLGKTTGWTNALMVGLLAEMILIAQQRPKLDEGYFDPFFDMANDPAGHWRILLELALSIPVAILGGNIWQKTGGPSKGQPETAIKPQPVEE